MTDTLVITNRDAGTTDEEAVEAAVTVLRRHGEVEVRATGSPDELEDLLAQVGARRIVVAGGDGSIHAVVAALHRRQTLSDSVLGLLPLGTGNDFARTLGIPLDAEAAAEALATGTPRRMDLLVDDDGGIVVNNVHLGAGAIAGRHGSRWKERLGTVGVGRLNLGRLGYPIGAAITAVRPPALRVQVIADGETVTGPTERVLMVVLGNGASVGGGTELAPDADPSDGWIDVLIATPESATAKARYAVGVLLRRHPEHENVRTVHATEVTVSGTEFWCSADGELSGPLHRRAWRLLPAAYTLLMPRESGAGTS